MLKVTYPSDLVRATTFIRRRASHNACCDQRKLSCMEEAGVGTVNIVSEETTCMSACAWEILLHSNTAQPSPMRLRAGPVPRKESIDRDLPACRTTGQPAAAHLAGLRHRERTMVRRMCWIRRPRKRVLRSAPWIVPAMSKISGDRVTIWPGSRWSLTRNSAGARSVACEGRHRDSRWAAFVEAQLNACRAAKR